MRYRILGPLEVLDNEGRTVALGGPRERVLLATLLLEANRVVSSDRLIDAIWGESPPETAANALQVNVSKLRKRLAPSPDSGSPLFTEAPGYVLRTAPGELDSELFEKLAERASDDDPASVSGLLGEALALWNGPVLDGIETDVPGRSAVVRLEEMQISVLERRIQADLAQGLHGELIGELESLVHLHPLREGLRCQLMLALYRSGRQAEALAVYRETRETLSEELGIDPSPALQELELAILKQSPDLDLHFAESMTPAASEQPSGTVTLLFTDIEGSTRMWEQDPKAMNEALQRHDGLLRSAIETSGGYVFKTVGDAFCAVFSSAKGAVKAAADAQRSLSAENWPTGIPLRVRMGLHTGECEERGGDYFGPPVNRVARLMSVAHGGQVICSRATADMVGEGLPRSLGLRELGTHRLKDLSRPEELFQLVVEGLSADFPPLRSLDDPSMPNNLPEFVSSFVGRETEVGEVRRLIEESRLVTLVGPGGVGKTRLGLQVAAELLDGSGDGVWMVALESVGDPDSIPREVAKVLGIKEQTGQPVEETLVEALADRSVLVVLDNCEHLIGACAKLADVLVRGCLNLHLLSTSREPLGIDGERIFRVPSLSIPKEDAVTASSVATSEAVALFVERARTHTAGFSLTGDSSPLVGAICRRLDGMPLAIELAVARLRSLSLADLNNRLDRRFQLLTGGSRSALPRHQTLRGVVDWSYDLLTEAEQVLLRRLPVFSGGFELDAAEGVCGFGTIEGFDVTVLLGGLVEKSLVATDTSTVAIRYRLLETIREYSAERLAEAGRDEARQLSDSHAEFYLAYAETAAPELTGPDQGGQIARLGTEYPNLYAALEHLSERDDQREQALRLAVALRRFWHGVGATSGEILLLEGILQQSDPEIPTCLMAAGLLCKSDLLRAVDLAASVQSGNEALELAWKCGDPKLIAETLGFHSFTTLMNGDGEGALSLASEAITFARRCGDPIVIGESLNCFANAVEESDPPAAERLYRESITLCERSGNWSGLWRSHNNLGYLLTALGRLGEAREHLESALVAASRIGSDVYTAFARGNLGWVLVREGDVNGAATNFSLCMRGARRSGQIRRVFSNVACGLACCASRDGSSERAAALHGIAQAALDAYGGNWDPLEQRIHDADLAQLRRTLGTSFERWYESGRMMGRDEAFAFVLNV
jgi:predicted ATPase/class 3 adenylate cyclase/DNA-binding SARP family transcriptional activator